MRVPSVEINAIMQEAMARYYFESRMKVCEDQFRNYQRYAGGQYVSEYLENRWVNFWLGWRMAKGMPTL